MPAKSKSQFRFMKAAESGSIKVPGLSRKEAKEFTSENKSYKDLPETSGKKDRFKKVKEYLGK